MGISFDGQYIASICEDDTKKYQIDIYEGITKNQYKKDIDEEEKIGDISSSDPTYSTQGEDIEMEDVNRQGARRAHHLQDFNSSRLVGLNGSNFNKTLFSHSTTSSKYCMQWHPWTHILAFAGEERKDDKLEGMVHLV